MQLFKEDAARWVVPERRSDPDALTIRTIARLLHLHIPLRAMAWLRFGTWAQQAGIRGVPGFVQRRLIVRYGLELSPKADIGGGLYIAHPTGCTLSAERIGSNVTVIGPVTVGYRVGRRWPRIDDEAYLGAGARILGDLTVGRGAKVGANAVVLIDVPPGATAIGVPATIRD